MLMCCATSTFPLIGLSASRHYVTSNNTSYYILIQLNCINFIVYIIVLTTVNRPKRVGENCRSLWLITLLFCSIYIYIYISKEEFTVQYSHFDAATDLVRKLGIQCFMSKVDIKRAFRFLHTIIYSQPI